MLLFRDFLRTHAQVARAYAHRKQCVAAVDSADVERYTNEKGQLIEQISKERFSRAEDADLINEIYRPIMDHLDVDYEWAREGEETTFRLRRRE